MKVLIVDASKQERARLVDALCEMTNVVVIGAVSRLHTALHALAENVPDVLITEAQLGEDDGSALIAAARRCANPPAIVVFASDDSIGVRLRCREAGADRFVSKDHGLSALQHAVLVVYQSRRASHRPSERDRLSSIGRIAAGAAHDLNNYLTVIEASLSLLQKHLDSRVEKELSLIRRALHSAARLNSTILAYAEGGEPTMGTVDVAAVIRKVLELFGRSIPMDVRTKLELDSVAPVRAVEIELEQLVLNLLLNACDAMPTTGELYIGLRESSDSRVRLELSHTGQADDGAPDRGLGLDVVRSIARRHGATLRRFRGDHGGARTELELVTEIVS